MCRVTVQLALSFGIEHYYKAKILPRILYVEGSTYLAILKSLAKKLKHKAYDILSGKLNYYYIRDTIPDKSLQKRLDRLGGAYPNFKQHFHTLKHFVKDFKGIAVFNSDGRNVRDLIEKDLSCLKGRIPPND